MVNLYRGAGIFASEEPVRQTTKRLANLSPQMVFPMHGSCIDDSIFPNYIDAIMNSNFAYIGMLLGQKFRHTIRNGQLEKLNSICMSVCGQADYKSSGNYMKSIFKETKNAI